MLRTDVENWKTFVQTPATMKVTERALIYLRAGFPINFSGPAGVGKTSLALAVARLLNRPIIFISGDEQLKSTDLVGWQAGYYHRRIVDNFVRSVIKTQDEIRENWEDGPLTVACKNGFTLLYDEFTRSRPEANNILLPVLEEGVLLPPEGHSGGAVKVDPQFRAIFTSNPLEYAGTFHSPDALLDRLVTIHMGYYDEMTELSITQAQTGVSKRVAMWAVRLIRACRAKLGATLSTRACIVLGKVLKTLGSDPSKDDQVLRAIVEDLVTPGNRQMSAAERAAFERIWDESFSDQEG